MRSQRSEQPAPSREQGTGFDQLPAIIEVEQAVQRSLDALAGGILIREQLTEEVLDPFSLARRWVVGGDRGSRPDHVCQRAERGASPEAQCAAQVPLDLRRDAVDVL